MSSEPSIDTLISGTSSKNSDPPTAKELHSLHDKIRDTVNKFMGNRGVVCDRSMRQLVQRRKERLQLEREQEAERQAREQAAKREQEESERKKAKKEKTLAKKRSHDEMELDAAESEERKQKKESLPSVGAHGLARQDGVGVHEGTLNESNPHVTVGLATYIHFDLNETHVTLGTCVAIKAPARQMEAAQSSFTIASTTIRWHSSSKCRL